MNGKPWRTAYCIELSRKVGEAVQQEEGIYWDMKLEDGTEVTLNLYCPSGEFEYYGE